MRYTLKVMCGVPGSGKTTWAKKNGNADVYISRDEIRYKLLGDSEGYFSKEKQVWREFVNQICRNLVDKQECLVDATHLTSNSRRKLLNAIDAAGLESRYDTIFIEIVPPSLEICQRRNALRKGLAQVPEDQLEDMFNKFTEPSLDEHPSVIGVWKIEEERVDKLNDLFYIRPTF